MQNMKDDLSLGAMVRLLVADLHKKEVSLPFRDQEPWHLLFYALKKMDPNEPGKPKFLDELVFDWDGPSPKCEELSEFLNGLHITANVSGHNPRFEHISVDDEDANRWLEDLKKLDKYSKSFVLRATEIAREEFAH